MTDFPTPKSCARLGFSCRAFSSKIGRFGRPLSTVVLFSSSTLQVFVGCHACLWGRGSIFFRRSSVNNNNCWWRKYAKQIITQFQFLEKRVKKGRGRVLSYCSLASPTWQSYRFFVDQERKYRFLRTCLFCLFHGGNNWRSSKRTQLVRRTGAKQFFYLNYENMSMMFLLFPSIKQARYISAVNEEDSAQKMKKLTLGWGCLVVHIPFILAFLSLRNHDAIINYWNLIQRKKHLIHVLTNGEELLQQNRARHSTVTAWLRRIIDLFFVR